MVFASALLCTAFGIFVLVRYRSLAVPVLKIAAAVLTSALPGLVAVSLTSHKPQWGGIYAEVAEALACILVIVTFFNGERDVIMAVPPANASTEAPMQRGRNLAMLTSMGGVFCVFVSIVLVVAHVGNYAIMLSLSVVGLVLIVAARRWRVLNPEPAPKRGKKKGAARRG